MSTAVIGLKEALEAKQAQTLADDMLRGAGEIAYFIYGASGIKERKRVYHLVDCGKLPVFRLGSQLCALKSTIRQDIERQQAASLGA